jgi:autotransporter passenger strand-loop-strand repeat protein
VSGSVISFGGQEVVSSGGKAVSATVSANGLLTVSSGGAAAGGLTLAGGRAVIAGEMAGGQIVVFKGPTAVLELHDLPQFHATISGMTGSGQKIDLRSFAFSAGESVSWTQSGTSGTLTLSGGFQVARLTLIGSYATSDFNLAGDGKGGTVVSDAPASNGVAPSGRAAPLVQAAAGLHGGRYTAGLPVAGGGRTDSVAALPIAPALSTSSR